MRKSSLSVWCSTVPVENSLNKKWYSWDYRLTHFIVLCRYCVFFKINSVSSVPFSRSVVSNSLRPHELQNARPPSPSPTPWVHPNPCPLSRWCHPVISSSVIPFSSCPQSFPASGSFQMSQLVASGGQSIGASASASVRPMNTQTDLL